MVWPPASYPWPDPLIFEEDLGARVGIPAPGGNEYIELGRVLGAVRSKIMATHALPLVPTSDQLDAWDEAHVLAAARLWKRKDTPEGIIDFGGAGVIRVGRFDADVEDLLAEFVVYAVG